MRDDVLTQERVNLLAGALEMDGALPALRTLSVNCTVAPGDLSRLMRALTGGAAPILQHLILTVDGILEQDLVYIADMLEARVRLPGCKRLESFKWDGNSNWFDRASLATRCRLLRVLLPSVSVLAIFTWNQAFGPCFLEVQLPHLTTLKVWLEDEESGFSWDILEATPALRRIHVDAAIIRPLGGAVLQAISAALRHGALGSLQHLALWDCTVGDRDVSDFMDALEKSGCAKRLTSLLLDQCNIGVAGVQALANLLGRDVFPALKQLSIMRDPGVTDVGVVALAEGLLEAKGIFLEQLDLTKVGISNEGIAALADLISHRRLKQLKGVLDLFENEGVTNEGVVALARSIQARGLPMLEEFKLTGLDADKVTLFGISAIALAVITRCPKLKRIGLTCAGPDDVYYEMVTGMLAAAGRAGEVKVGDEVPVNKAGKEEEEEED